MKTQEVQKTHKFQETPETYRISKLPLPAMLYKHSIAGKREKALPPARLPARHVGSSEDMAFLSSHPCWAGFG